MSSPIISMGDPELCPGLINNLNNLHPEELSLPGNWSGKLFSQDFSSEHRIADLLVQELKQTCPSYLNFYLNVHQQTHPKAHKSEIWEIFSSGSIMLYFEPLFLRFLDQDELSQSDKVLLQYLTALSKTPITKWDEIVKQIGACCHQFFIKEPELYIGLLFRQDSKSVERMTDDEIFKQWGSKLVYTNTKGKISCQDSRSQLINIYLDTKANKD